jgi:MFS family permease
MLALGATPVLVGLYGTASNVISAVYPYPGGAISDRIGSRRALTLFGACSTAGFLVWLLAPLVGTIDLAGVAVEPWVWVFVGLLFAQAWKSLGLGATFAIVKQSVAPGQLARGFASTETFRRTAFLLGPVGAAGLLFVAGGDLLPGFLVVLGVAVGVGAVATLIQHYLYDADEDSLGTAFAGLDQIRRDLAALPDPLRPLLVADTLVRFANGMVYVFFVVVVVELREVGLAVAGLDLSPAVFFGLLLGVEMVVALLSMYPVARVAERTGLKPVVAVGFVVYAVFPVVLVVAPANPWVYVALFAFSGLRFAGLPAHKALIVGPAEADAGGRVTGAYYLLRNTIVIPSAALGGVLWEAVSPEAAFTVATAVGVVGVAYFLVAGEEFDAYR